MQDLKRKPARPPRRGTLRGIGRPHGWGVVPLRHLCTAGDGGAGARSARRGTPGRARRGCPVRWSTARGGPRVQGPPPAAVDRPPESGLQLSPKPSNPSAPPSRWRRTRQGSRKPLPVNLHPLFKHLRAVGRSQHKPSPTRPRPGPTGWEVPDASGRRKVGDAPIFPDASATPTGSANSAWL